MITYDPEPQPIKIDEFVQNEKALGYTNDFKVAGYITPEGNMVDLSQGSIIRTLDHRIISGGSNKGMQEYIAKGNIRFDGNRGIFHMYKQPTSQQYMLIEKFINQHPSTIEIDLQDGLGEYRDSRESYSPSENRYYKEFEEGIRPSVVINTIKRFYQ